MAQMKLMQRFINLYNNVISEKVYIPAIDKMIKRDELLEWEKNGRPLPPPHVYKENVVREYARKYGCEYFVETGTYLGDMVRSQISSFKVVSSVELSEELYNRAKRLFKRYNNVRMYQGDSTKKLSQMVDDLPQKEHILFWLDGHYSEDITARGDKDTPIMEEMDCLLNSVSNCVILIDDARCFLGKNDYPTLEYLKSYVEDKRSIEWSVENDIIRIILL